MEDNVTKTNGSALTDDDKLKQVLGRIFIEVEEDRKHGMKNEFQVTLSDSEFQLLDKLRRENKIKEPDGYIATGSLSRPKLMTAHGYSKLVASYFTTKDTDWPVNVLFKNLKYEVEVPSYDPGVTTINSAFAKCFKREKKTKSILSDISGVFKANSTTLVLGPPGSGCTTLFKCLADVLVQAKKSILRGTVRYSGYDKSQILVRKFSTYVDQHDIHTGTLTVRETLDFAFECFGGKMRYLGIDISKIFIGNAARPRQLKLSDVLADLKEYTIRRFGLEDCENTIVGNEILRGISGGEKRRLTNTEMFLGNKKLVFFDQLSTGLDTATAYDILSDLKHWGANLKSTFVFSLLQPTPEVFALFDEVLILADGMILYHGARENILPFFESIGFKCPSSKDAADFIQEITTDMREKYVISSEYKNQTNSSIAKQWQSSRFSEGKRKEIEEMEKEQPVENSITKHLLTGNNKFCTDIVTDFKLVFKRQTKLFYRNKPYLIARIVQCTLMSLFLGTVFYDLSSDLTSNQALIQQRLSLVFFICLQSMLSGFALVPHVFETRQVFYKHRRNFLHRSVTYTFSAFVVAIPMQILESLLLSSLTFWLTNLVPPEGGDAVQIYFFLVFMMCLVSMSLAGYIRFLASTAPTPAVSFVFTGASVATFILFSGFIVLPDNIPNWLIWLYWLSPLSWAIRSMAKRVFESDAFTPEETNRALALFSIEEDSGFVLYGVLYLLGFILLSQVMVVIALNTVNHDSSGKRRTVEEAEKAQSFVRQTSDVKDTEKDGEQRFASSAVKAALSTAKIVPTTVVFRNLSYTVPIKKKKKRKLLHNISGYAKPGTLTALMGASGAGKTTLMDVIAGRKTAGEIEGEVLVNGLPKPKEFASLMGYVEQNDVHCPHQTVREAIFFSARLRQPRERSNSEIDKFVDVVLKTLELDNISHFEVGVTGEGGLSIEEAKRLTIGVELAANPSVLFCDEPTSGLDSRAAEVVMTSIKRVARSGRTVICTIHQPNREIFELFDRMLLLQRGGKTVYFGDLGINSNFLVDYFEAIDGTPKISSPSYNPATYMLEVIGAGTANSGKQIDYSEKYDKSSLKESNLAEISQCAESKENRAELVAQMQNVKHKVSQLSQLFYLTKRSSLSFWRNPGYNIVRFVFMLVMATIWGVTYFQHAARGPDFTARRVIGIVGVLFTATIFIGVVNLNLVLGPMYKEKAAYLRERASLMYTPSVYLLSWSFVELPYLIVNSLGFCLVFYFLLGFEADFAIFCSYWLLFGLYVLTMTFMGHAMVAFASNQQTAGIIIALFVSTFSLFAGFLIASRDVSNFWQFMTYIVPTKYALHAVSAVFFACDCSTFEVLGPNATCFSDQLGCEVVAVPGSMQRTTAWDFLQQLYGFEDQFLTDILALCAFLLFFRVVALIAFTRVKAKR